MTHLDDKLNCQCKQLIERCKLMEEEEEEKERVWERGERNKKALLVVLGVGGVVVLVLAVWFAIGGGR